MKLNFHRYETKTLAELIELHDELVKKSGALGQKLAVLQQRITALKTANWKPKRASSSLQFCWKSGNSLPARIPPKSLPEPPPNSTHPYTHPMGRFSPLQKEACIFVAYRAHSQVAA